MLRRLGTLRHLLSHFLQQGPPANAPRVETALLIGAAQILWLDVPDHAAVSTIVALADRNPATRKFKGLINAVLRGLQRDGKPADDPATLAGEGNLANLLLRKGEPWAARPIYESCLATRERVHLLLDPTKAA